MSHTIDFVYVQITCNNQAYGVFVEISSCSVRSYKWVHFISGVISVFQTHWSYAHYECAAQSRQSMQYWLAIGINLIPCESRLLSPHCEGTRAVFSLGDKGVFGAVV